MSKGQVDFMHSRGSSGHQVGRVTRYFFQKMFPNRQVSPQDKKIILKAYSTQKVGSGGNFESGNQVYAAWHIYIDLS